VNKPIPENNDNAKSIINQYNDLYTSIDKSNPKTEQLIALQTLLKNNLIALNVIEAQMNIAQKNLLYFFHENTVDETNTTIVLNGMKDQMRYSDSSIVEKMVINDIILSWYRLQVAEWYLTHSLKNNANKIIIDTWDKMVSTAQKRYLRATETLVRIRKSGVKLQINIATDGGKQKNLQV
jgi:hypothetical protein